MHYKFVEFTYDKGGNRENVILDSETGRQSVPVEQVRVAMQNDKATVDGLRLDGRGLKVVGSSEKPQNGGKDSAKLGVLLKEIQDVKSLVNKVGRKVSELDQKNELVPVEPTQTVEITRQDIDALNQRLGNIEQVLGLQNNALLSLKDSLDQQNITIQEYYDSFRKDLPEIFKKVLDAQEPEFPVCKKDLNYAMNYADNESLFADETAFEGLATMCSELGVDTPIYDENMITSLSDTLSKVNKARSLTAEVFVNDISDERGMFKTEADTAVKGVADSYLLLMAELPVAVAVGTFKAFGNLVTNVAKSAAYGLGYEDSDRAKIRKNLKGTSIGFNRRPTGIYQEYCHYQLNPNNTSEMEIFSYDIRCFVIDMLSALYKGSFFDDKSKNKIKHIKDKLYYKTYLKDSMCVGLSVHNNDELLLRYYCHEIIGRLNEIEDYDKALTPISDTKSYNHMLRKTSASGLESAKALYDCFVNAYFTAKKMMLQPDSIDSVISSYDFLDRNTLGIQDKTKKMRTFLSYVYIGLVYQGISQEKAQCMIIDFQYANSLNL